MVLALAAALLVGDAIYAQWLEKSYPLGGVVPGVFILYRLAGAFAVGALITFAVGAVFPDAERSYTPGAAAAALVLATIGCALLPHLCSNQILFFFITAAPVVPGASVGARLS